MEELQALWRLVPFPCEPSVKEAIMRAENLLKLKASNEFLLVLFKTNNTIEGHRKVSLVHQNL